MEAVESKTTISEASQQAEGATTRPAVEPRAVRRARKTRKAKASASGAVAQQDGQRRPLPRSETSRGRGGGHVDDCRAYLPTPAEIAAEAARLRAKHYAAKLAEAPPNKPPPGRLATLAPVCTAGLTTLLMSSSIRLAK